MLRHRELILSGLAAGFGLLGALTLALAPWARTNTWFSRDVRDGVWPLGAELAIWLGCFLVAQLGLHRSLPHHDPYLLPSAYLLTGWGILIIGRLLPDFGLRQAIWLIPATALMLIIVALPGNLRWLRRYRYTWLLGGLLLMALTFIFGVNPSGIGQRLWLGGPWLYLQPAEFLKLLLIIFLASYLAERRELLVGPALPADQAVHPLRAARLSLPYFLPLLIMWGFSLLMLVFQRDLGMSTLVFVLFLIMLYLASGQTAYLLIGGGLLLAGGVAAYSLFDVVQLRVEAWWNPWLDPAGRSYQVVQSLIAFSVGGLTGRGPGLGFPALIPLAHSDFIFSALAEEWGLWGVLGMLALLAGIVFRGLRIALQTRGTFGQLLAGGLAALLGLQALIILGGVVKLIPLTGLTLPFVSYGGSSLVTTFCALGLLLRLSDKNVT